jgi:hypothetical protein
MKIIEYIWGGNEITYIKLMAHSYYSAILKPQKDGLRMVGMTTLTVLPLCILLYSLSVH